MIRPRPLASLASFILLCGCASTGSVVSPECAVSAPTLFLESVGPAVGTDPVWIVGEDCWQDGPAKTIWVVDRTVARGRLEIEGRGVGDRARVRFGRSGTEPKPRLVIASAESSRVTPGGAPDHEMARYAFHTGYVYYPSPGCWRFNASVGGAEVDITVERLRCDSNGQPLQRYLSDARRQQGSRPAASSRTPGLTRRCSPRG